MRADIETLLTEYRNKKSLGNPMKNKIEPLSSKTTTREVRNLVRDNNPFNNNLTSSNNKNTRNHGNNNIILSEGTPISNNDDTKELETSHKRRRTHKHNHNRSNASDSSHSRRHKHSHGQNHSHGRKSK